MKWKNFLSAARLYWRAIFSIIWPLVLLSIIIIEDSQPRRCLFVVLLMIGYWLTEAIHIIITSFLPILLLPILNVLSTTEVCKSYMDGANMMFLVSIILASSVQYSRLHERIALVMISVIGCSPKKLQLGIVTITAFNSMWLSNTATTNVMISIVSSILSEFESHGIVNVYDTSEEKPSASQLELEAMKKPTQATECYYISVAYASIIGSIGTLIGTEVNITFKGLFERTFRDGPTISFGNFMLTTLPVIIIILMFSTLVLQIWFLGLFRPNSKEAKVIAVSEEVEAIAKSIIDLKRKELGRITLHEIAVSFCYLLAILFWIIRSSHLVTGWIKTIKIKINDSTIGVAVVILMFCIPIKHKNMVTGLTTWKLVHKIMPWGVLFLIGSGLALANAIKVSTMDNYMFSLTGYLNDTNPYIVLVISCISVAFLTQFTTNVVLANITLPIMVHLAQDLHINPLFFMYPVTLSCSFTFMFPVSAPPNSVAAMTCNMATKDMIKVGFFILIISLLILFVASWIFAVFVWDISVFPDWAKNTTASSILDKSQEDF
ncbi:hypothetical protein WA026_019997 [Henosepilachna vigintioctopunctata]|uniref:Uncharacterized protein n=1 Tax=Henosepilachna vigintioctopunctata TaxID=420089 RepID=A0AAW1V2U8_9CUCU